MAATCTSVVTFRRDAGVWLLAILLGAALMACGGGGGGGQNSPDFSLTINPRSISIPAGSSGSISVSATALNGFSSEVTVQVTGLPSGVSAGAATITVVPGTPQSVTFTVSPGSAATSTTATFTGTSVSLTHSTTLTLAVTANNSGTLSTRTKYVRTDATTEYFLWLNTHWTVFHSPTSRFFVTDPQFNRVEVLDATSETLVASIAVPGAFAIDETPDESTVYVGTLIGDVYTIDPVKMAVARRYQASEIGPYGYEAVAALPMADGTIALLGAQGGIPSVDGSSSFATWNPADNSITMYGNSGFPGPSASRLCGGMGNIGGFGLTADRTAILLGSIDSDGTLCELVPSTGLFTFAQVGSPSKITVSPDGKYLVFPSYPTGITLYDAHTLTQTAQFNTTGDISSGSDFFFSPDSQTLFVSGAQFVYAYNVASQQQIGWLPNLFVTTTSGGLVVGPITGPDFEAMDPTGLLVGPLEEGFGFLDTTQMRSGSVGTGFTNAYLNPATGPTSGGTVTQWNVPSIVTAQTPIYIGGKIAPSVSISGAFANVTTPPGNPGPADAYLFTSDGGMQLVPEAFSYGPTILEVAPNMASSQGGGTGVIYGYGLGSNIPADNGTYPIPSGLSISVGGKAATILAFNGNAYDLLGQPFLLESVYYTIPSGTVGSADVTVTSASGSATATAAMTYLPDPGQYPLIGASLAQGIYDPHRDLYYFTDANKIQVFSLTQGQWLSPINIPPPVPNAAQRLWGISLSPDGNTLAIADVQAGVVYVLNPSSPSSVKSFVVQQAFLPGGTIEDPTGVAVTDAGVVYVTDVAYGGDGYHGFFKLDTTTGVVTDYGIDNPGGGSDVYLRTALSSDGTRVYFDADGYLFDIDTATDTIFPATAGQGCCYGDYDLTLAPNQTQVEGSSYLFDSNLNAQSFLTLDDRVIEDTVYVYGTKLSPDGSLLFQPSAYGIDVFDGHLGTLRNRIGFPFALSTNYDALVSDGKDNVLIAITGTSGDGIAVVDLTSVPEPPPLPYARPTTEGRGISSQPGIRAGDLRLTRSQKPPTQNRVFFHITHSPPARHK